jgi:hypothetical protein
MYVFDEAETLCNNSDKALCSAIENKDHIMFPTELVVVDQQV